MDLGKIFKMSWYEFVEDVGKWILLWLINFGISIVLAILALPSVFAYVLAFYNISENRDFSSSIPLLIFASIASIFFIVINIAVAGVLDVWTSKLGLEKTRKKILRIEDFFYGFKNKPFKFIKLCFLLSIYTFLWSLLFIIPGIIKSISYSQSFYIMIENPEYTASECIKESMKIMDGNKGNYFLLILFFVIINILLAIIQFILNFIPILGGLISFCLNVGVGMVITPISILVTANFYNEITDHDYSDYSLREIDKEF